MTPEKIALVRDSFARVQPIAPQAAALFYDRLFAVAPEVKPLFKGDMTEQGKKLMATIAVAVTALDRLPSILPVIEALARRHVGYGIKPEHYDIVGGALLWTLEQGLGPAFTPETKEAWAQTYDVLATAMKAAAY
jgi:hemoglobin-like flavoprotein